MTVLGGDERSFILAELFVANQMDVTLYGFDQKESISQMKQAKSLKEAIQASDIIVGPLPFMNHKDTLNAPFTLEKIELEDVYKEMNEKQILFGGHIPQKWLETAKEYQVNIVDYFNREELQVLNAIPTAEGAIQIAMEKMNRTIHGANVMVVGFGRIGKTLAKTLTALGANVHVSARKHADIAWIKSYQCVSIYVNDMENHLSHMDLIINTVPAVILKKLQLEKIQSNCLIIDVASDPGGIDELEARKMGVQCIRALGLPGIVAPVSAAECIKETIDHLIEELEV